MNARKKLVAQWEPAGDVKDTMSGREGKREVVVPGSLESSQSQMEQMVEYAKKPAKELRKDDDPETAFKMLRR